jgi:DNA-binding MarR family transcriptional regulator
MEEPDFVRSLGLPFLAHRLRRASELIVEGSSEALCRFGFDGPARSVSTLLLLKTNGATSITEIAHRLRLSHPLIIKLAEALAGAGLVRAERDPQDQRRRLITLTARGEAEVERIEAFLYAIAGVFTEIFAEGGADLFAALERFEAAMERTPIARRIDRVLEEQLRTTS